MINNIAQKADPSVDLPPVDDVANAMSYYANRVCRDLKRIYLLSDNKINVEYVMSIVAAYEALLLDDPEAAPDRTPEDILRDDVLPYIASMELTVEENSDGFEVTDKPQH